MTERIRSIQVNHFLSGSSTCSSLFPSEKFLKSSNCCGRRNNFSSSRSESIIFGSGASTTSLRKTSHHNFSNISNQHCYRCHFAHPSILRSPDQYSNMAEQLILKGTLEGHSGWVTSLATSLENPNMLLSGSRDKSLIIWNLTRDETSYGYPKRSLHGHSHIVSDCVC